MPLFFVAYELGCPLIETITHSKLSSPVLEVEKKIVGEFGKSGM